MDRVRRAGSLALFLMIAAMAIGSMPVVPAGPSQPTVDGRLAAAVGWPTSTLLISEVMTGGASASDEFAELTNAGASAVDLAGLEVAYVTSTGGTVTRKATWPGPTILEPGRHLLIANTTGIYAATADATYSGGFAATGGALVLRPLGGTPIDAVGWGDATNAFVEGSAVAAPAAGSSVERLPGGAAGNGTDSNDNAADFALRATPTPQNLAAPAVPAPSASPSAAPSPTAIPTPTPTPIPTPTPVPTPTPTPTPVPTPVPTPTSTPVPTPSPTPTPTPLPTPTPTPVPTPTPTPTPASVITSIAEARSLPDGTEVTIDGTLTTALGAIDSARNGFVQDPTAGIAIRLDAALASPYAPGTTVRATGTLGSYFSLRTLVVQATDVIPTGSAPLPDPLSVATGSAGEGFEGLRLIVGGVVTEAPSALADGLGVTVDDGTGPIRTVISTAALAGATIATGDGVIVIGPLGQRDSSGTGAAGYRIHATQGGELVVIPPPSPSPSPSPSASPEPTASPIPSSSIPPGPSDSPAPTPAPSAAPSPTPTPNPTPAPSSSPTPGGTTLSIADARTRTIGASVAVVGVVTAEAGRLGTPPLIAIQDATAGIVVRLPDGVAGPARGTTVQVIGRLADPYGQIELRPATADFHVLASGALTSPAAVDAAGLGEASEGRLVETTGVVDARPTRSTSGDISLDLRVSGGVIRVFADVSSGLTKDSFAVGATYDIVGIAGQRASRKGALDGYRIWVRDGRDLVRRSGPSPTPTPSPSPGGSGSSATVSIADAIRAGKGVKTVEGVVTIAADLLDASGRRIVIEDRTAGLEILIPTDGRAPAVGSRIRAQGTIGRAWDAPRLKATRIDVLATGIRTVPATLHRPPTAALEWRLVQVAGTVVEVHKLGDRWRAELSVGTERVVISGLAGARIPVTTLAVGRHATVTGVARRPYPGATDRRWSVVPRSQADVVVSAGSGGGGDGSSSGQSTPSGPDGSAAPAGGSAPLDVDLVALGEHVGQTIRVGGLVSELLSDGFLLDDGTAVGRVRLGGSAADYLALLETSDAVNATGTVESEGSGYVVVVDEAAGLVRAGDPDQGATIGPAASADVVIPSASADPAGARQLAGGLLDAAFPGAAGLLGLALASVASVAVTVLRRYRGRRQLARRMASRLATFAGTPGGHA